MKKSILVPAIIAALGLSLGLVAGTYVGIRRGIPFVAQREQWTIGIVTGTSPFDFPPAQRRGNPVLRAEDVTDVPAKFVADPFLMRNADTWQLFFEVYNLATDQGDLALATSHNGQDWKYQGLIIDEPFHLSYPYVFQWQDDTYLIPESYEAGQVRLYQADNYPTGWRFAGTLIDNQELVDPSIVRFEDRWWLFATGPGNDTLRLFFADELLGPWQEHPQSPIVAGNPHIARSSGRILVLDDRVYRYTMDVDPPVGTHQVWAMEITTLTPAAYAERKAREEPILKPSGTGWNAQAMHQIDPWPIAQNRWLAAVDGFGTYLVFGLKY